MQITTHLTAQQYLQAALAPLEPAEYFYKHLHNHDVFNNLRANLSAGKGTKDFKTICNDLGRFLAASNAELPFRLNFDDEQPKLSDKATAQKEIAEFAAETISAESFETLLFTLEYLFRLTKTNGETQFTRAVEADQATIAKERIDLTKLIKDLQDFTRRLIACKGVKNITSAMGAFIAKMDKTITKPTTYFGLINAPIKTVQAKA